MTDFNTANTPFDYARGFTIDFDLRTGASALRETSLRPLSAVKGIFADEAAADEILKKDDPLIYEFHELSVPEHPGDLAFGCSKVYPGKIGKEYYMTKGHFHTVLDTGEVYYCLAGHGYMMLENPEGDWSALELGPGKAVYVPRRYAHRSINVDPVEPLLTFFVFRADAGHDYGTIAANGYRKLLIEENGKPCIMDNPKWSRD
ncbi:MAG: glucose-6-phosphate isomerase [Planctomycetaceae bacterium]|nr:glucose-6-phosphate isomerase [Planctomycetaceae bacterium]